MLHDFNIIILNSIIFKTISKLRFLGSLINYKGFNNKIVNFFKAVIDTKVI